MLRKLKSFLGRNLLVKQAAWKAGELIHHRGPTLDRGRGKGSLLPSGAERGFLASLGPAPGASNPVVTACDVTDYGTVDYVADPFLLQTAPDEWHMFFEVNNRKRCPTGVIGHAESDDGLSWRYDRVVLAEERHLAFPYVFEHDDQVYMIPERWNRSDPADLRLYTADRFPFEWTPVTTVISPERFLSDPVLFRHNDRWWIFVGTDDGTAELHAYHSPSIHADHWTPHTDNPVVRERPRAARPGGRPVVTDDGIVLLFQDCDGDYGRKVRAFEVLSLSPDTYRDREHADSPVLEPPARRLGWNSGRMHHLDHVRTEWGWRCAVDGNIAFGRSLFGGDHWAIGIYDAYEDTTSPPSD